MRVAFITRSTIQAAPGGDTVHIQETAAALRTLGVEADTWRTDAVIPYHTYDLFHFFNLIRPADILPHLSRIHQPYLLTPVLVDYSEYDRLYRRGFSGWLFRHLSSQKIEYFKTIARWIKGQEPWPGWFYLARGQYRSMKKILRSASMVLPGSELEQQALNRLFAVEQPCKVIYNGINTALFQPGIASNRDPALVICAARIEGLKNQLQLIRALNNTPFTLMLIGRAAPNQQAYFEQCKKEAASNVIFRDHVSQEELKQYYRQATVHVLPSWFETCGLSSLEAASMGCNIVITDRGFAREYFGKKAFYCQPGDAASIRAAVEQAAAAGFDLSSHIQQQFTWEKAAQETQEVYKKVLGKI